MVQFFADYLARLERLHGDLKAAAAALPAAALDWRPGSDTNSLAALIVHTAGSQRYWIGDVAGQEPSGRDRDAEFRATGLNAGDLAEQLDAVLAHSRSVLQRLSLDDLAQMRTSPRDGRQFTAGWALAHALEHTAIHAGHAQLTRQLWDQQREIE